MTFAVKWTENLNGKTIKRELVVQREEFAKILYNRIVVDCKHWDAILVTRKR